MRLKINLNLEKIALSDIASETGRVIHKLLGVNNKWHDMQGVKPYTTSLITGGNVEGEYLKFKSDSKIYFNTVDVEVIEAIMINNKNGFEIENNKVFSGYNILVAKRVLYNHNGKTIHIDDENKADFEKLMSDKFSVNFEILKIQNRKIKYKNKVDGTKSILNTTDLLIKVTGSISKVSQLIERGIGASNSIGFGFIEFKNDNI